jgi:hypothetical protein
MNRRKLVEQLAPSAPACFPTRLGWIEYLGAAAEAQRGKGGQGGDGEPGPLILEAGKPVRFNWRFDYCADCAFTQLERMDLAQIGVCQPDHLRRREPKTEAANA